MSQIDQPVYRSLSRWCLAAAITAMAAFGVAEGDSLIALAIPGAVLCWVISGGSRPRAFPRVLVNALLGTVASYSLFIGFSGGLDVELFSHVLTLLILIKLFDRRLMRDTAQIVSLSLFLAIGGMLTSNDLLLGLILAAHGLCLLMAVCLLQIAWAVERSGPQAQPESQPDAQLKPLARAGSKQGLPWDKPATVELRRLGLATAVFVFICSMVVFVVMPRGLGSSTFGSWGNPGLGAVVGFTDEIDLRRSGLISESMDPVLDLRVTGPEGEQLGEVGRAYYLRGAVLGRYTQRGWEARDGLEPRLGMRRVSTTRSIDLPDSAGRAREIEQEITVRNLPKAGATLFSVWEPLEIQLKTPAQFNMFGSERVLEGGNQRGRFSYTVRSGPPVKTDGLGEDEAADLLAASHAAAVEDDHEYDPRVVELAQQIMTDAGVALLDGQAGGRTDGRTGGRVGPDDIERAVNAIKSHYSRERFSYTLDTPRTPRGEDSIAAFLFDTQRGHCEYFASSMGVLCRAVGINARVITGYAASEFNAATGYYVVRASDAHAWLEVEVAPGLWKTIDPTPSAEFDRIHTPEVGLWASLRQVYEAFEFAWIRSFVGFDGESRAAILGTSTTSSTTVNQQLLGLSDRIVAGGLGLVLRSLGVAGLVFFGVYVAGLVLLYSVGNRAALVSTARVWLMKCRQWVPWLLSLPGLRRAAEPTPQEAAAILDRALARAGLARPAWLPLGRHMAECGVLERLTPDQRDQCIDAVNGVYRWAYGPGLAGSSSSGSDNDSDVGGLLGQILAVREAILKTRGQKPAPMTQEDR